MIIRTKKAGAIVSKETLFGKRLRQLRDRLGVTQGYLGAEVLGWEPAWGAAIRINKYEKGVRTPAFANAIRLADKLGIPSSFFYEQRSDLADLVMVANKLDESRVKKLVEQLRNEVGEDGYPKSSDGA